MRGVKVYPGNKLSEPSFRLHRKQQFCKSEMKPNALYKPELKDPSPSTPIIDKTRVQDLRKSLNCKGKMLDCNEICVFPERYLRSHCIKPVKKPPPTNAFKAQKATARFKSAFQREYDRGDLPFYIGLSGTKRRIAWKFHYGEVDFVKYLPIFFCGIREKREPLKFLARQGTYQLLQYVNREALLECLPEIARQIRTSFDTKDKDIVCETLKCIQCMVFTRSDIGPDLVQYYKHILPGMRMFMNRNVNTGDKFEYGQHKKINISDLIHETLFILETHGGETAFFEIKRVVPLYNSQKQILSTSKSDELARKRCRPITRDMLRASKSDNAYTMVYNS